MMSGKYCTATDFSVTGTRVQTSIADRHYPSVHDLLYSPPKGNIIMPYSLKIMPYSPDTALLLRCTHYYTCIYSLQNSVIMHICEYTLVRICVNPIIENTALMHPRQFKVITQCRICILVHHAQPIRISSSWIRIIMVLFTSTLKDWLWTLTRSLETESEIRIHPRFMDAYRLAACEKANRSLK